MHSVKEIIDSYYYGSISIEEAIDILLYLDSEGQTTEKESALIKEFIEKVK